MINALTLDPLTGELAGLAWVARPGLRLADVPSSFNLKAGMGVQVEGRNVDCVFARASGDVDGLPADICLRFENERLTSVFITLKPTRFEKLKDNDWYNSVDARMQFHTRWLASLDLKRQRVAFVWNCAEVCRDKSENVYIALHSNP